MTNLKNVDLERGTVEVAEYSQTNAALAALRAKYQVVPDANTEEGYAWVKAGIKELTGLRTSLEAARKREKEPHLQAGRILDAEAKRITEELVSLEKPMKAAKQEVDDRIERERQERIARLQQKVDAIVAMPGQVRGKSSDEISAMIDRVGEIDATHDYFDLTKEAVEARQNALDELTQMLTDRLAFEAAEADRKKAEAALAEQNRQLEEQQAENRRLQDELAQARAALQPVDPVPAVPEQPVASPEPTAAQLEPLPTTKPQPIDNRHWHARVTNKRALIGAIAAGLAGDDLLIVDQAALDALADTLRQGLDIPGVIAEPISAAA
ncbi:hypothetical protein ACYCFL_05780 [Stutzerimonas nitrititolerans]|uniref:hypothetical protein n=1 Tax=Stutzerimonas nitrititolerans TaxID=2482751 RepID=UPI0028A1018B|nr:hypothetical protein [Stutzerimonas nitrititolerans]